MDIRNLLALIFRKIWIIGLVAFLGGAAVYLGMARSGVFPRYSATTVVAIGGDIYGEALDTTYIELAETMMANLLQLSKLEIVTGAVTRNLGLEESPESLTEMLEVSQIEGTNLLSIRATHHDPHTSVAIANEVANQLRHLSPARWRNFVLVMEPARLPESPDSDTVLPVVLTSFLAALSVICVIFLVEYFRQSIYDEQDVSEMLGLPTLLRLKPIPFLWKRCIRGTLMSETEPAIWWSLKEVCRQQMNQKEGKSDQQTILVISPNDSFSHAYVAGHLAIAFANEGQKTVLVDIDLIHADATKLFFNDPPKDGFGSLVRCPDYDSAKLLKNVPNHQNLWMLGSKEEAGMIDVNQFQEAIYGILKLAGQTPYTIISARPAAAGVETLMAAARANLVLMVIDVKCTRFKQAVENVALLAANNVRVGGVVLADLRPRGLAFSIAWRILPFIEQFRKRFQAAPKSIRSSYWVDRQT